MSDAKEADYLLETHGIISLPQEIDHAAYELLLYRVTYGRALYPNKALRLFCRSGGGFTYDALAMVDLIRADGNIDGMLAGAAVSSAAVIWASCARRFVYPMGRIGVHPVKEDHSAGDFNIFRAEMQELIALDTDVAQIFALASLNSGDWWLDKLHSSGDLKWLLAQELIDIGMAKPVSERKSS